MTEWKPISEYAPVNGDEILALDKSGDWWKAQVYIYNKTEISYTPKGNGCGCCEVDVDPIYFMKIEGINHD